MHTVTSELDKTCHQQKMLIKMPSFDWTEQFEYISEEEEDSLSDFDDEQDFSEYMWMEHEEEFDKNEMQRLEEEDIMQECIEAMLEDELEAQIEMQIANTEDLNAALSAVSIMEYNVEKSLLNPMAAEFIPQSRLVGLSTV